MNLPAPVRKYGAAVFVGILGAWALWGKRKKDFHTYCEAGVGTQFTPQQLQAFSTEIYTAFYASDWSEDEPAVIDVISRCDSYQDLMALACVYGERAPWYYKDLDLFATIHYYFNEEELEELNSVLSSKGIAFQI